VTTYTPYPTVSFAGTTYTDEVIASISVTNGRRDIMEQPQPSVSAVVMFTDANTPLTVELSQQMNIKISDSTGAYQTIFAGTVSDIDISLDQYGDIGNIATYSITCVGVLALLNKRTAGFGGFDEELDGTRILNILTQAFLTNWYDVSPTLTWAEFPNTTTWANYDGVNLDIVNNLAANIDAGLYTLSAYSDGETNAYPLAQAAAQSGRGVLYEDNLGEIHYGDFEARVSDSFITLTADDINARGLTTAAQWSEIVNDATVTYTGGSRNARDETSIILYGQLAGSRNTTLKNADDAADQALAFVEARAYPLTYPETLSVPLHSPTVSNITRDLLIAANVSDAVTTAALPAVFGNTFNGFIEGINWQITRYTADLTLTLSQITETYPSLIWFQVPPATTWAGYTPSNTEWKDA